MNKIFPPFYFKPTKLEEEVQRIKGKYKEKGDLPNSVINKKLPDLLKQIRKLKNDQAEILRFARKLKKIEVNILSLEYPYEKENENTIWKIVTILKEKYNSLVGKRFWNHYQYSPYDENIYNLLSYAFDNEDGNFLALKPEVRENYNQLFKADNNNEIIPVLSSKIAQENRLIAKSFKDWKIEEDTKLSEELWLYILGMYLKEKWFVDTQGAEEIERRLSHIDLNKYKSIIVPYLQAFDYKAYDERIFAQVISRLKDPRKNTERWFDIPDDVIKKVKSRLHEKDLYLFFSDANDSERFRYWQRYIKHMDDVDLVKDPPIAAMYFHDFAVVEFANKGNAAYFYKREGFSKFLAHKVKRDIKESELKDQHADYFINKINHAGHWPSRYDQYMVNYLRGNFRYYH